MKGRLPAFFFLLVVGAVFAPAALAVPVQWETPAITSDTSWSGEIRLRQSVTVATGATLRILPGTKVQVDAGKGIGITVLGRMVAGEKGKPPVEFLPGKPGGEKAQWEGIALQGGKAAGHALHGVLIRGAREGIALTETTAAIEGGAFVGCATGIRWNQKSSASVDNCAFEGNDIGAVLSLGGEAVVRGCRFADIKFHGIVVDKGAALRVSGSSFSRGKTGIFSLTDAPCRVDRCGFTGLETGIAARQMGKDSGVDRCLFENNETGILAVQFSSLQVSDSVFRGNKAAVDVREFSTPTLHHNRFEGNEVSINLFRKAHAVIRDNVFFHNRNAIVVNYSSYPLVAGNNFDRNDMSVRLETFQSGDWEERSGSSRLMTGEAALRGSRSPIMDQALGQKVSFPKRVNAKGNYWGPDADRDPAKGTLGKIRDGKTFGPVRYEGYGTETYRIDVVDFSDESPGPFPGAGPRGPAEVERETK
ncbi:MAG: right-handed parallel beta-helix repeat-containing protein [bacterium]|jgi:parallel beta-helix repeat protein